MSEIVAITSSDRARVLALNTAHVVELSPLDEQSLAALLDGSFYAARIGNLDALLIALDENHATYTSPNYLWFRQRYHRFVYVDRIVVADHARGKGYAKRLYRDLMARATLAGHEVLVCEVNSEPPNAASEAFHAFLGFKVVGTATINGGAKTVSYLARRLF